MNDKLTLVSAAAQGQRVYFAWDGCAHIKIGTSIATARRGGELKIKMILSVPGVEIQERRFHKMWAGCRVGGPASEWFWPTDGLIAFLHAMIDSGGCRLECGDELAAHRLVSEIYEARWNIAA